MHIHQEYYKTIIHRDIIERFDAIHPRAVVQVAFRLITSVSSLYSINRLTEYLKSIGLKVSKDFVSACIEWFEDAYFIFSVKIFDKSLSKQNVNAKKAYCIDHSLVTSVCPGASANDGYLLENLIFCYLRRKTNKIFYYRTKKGNEVDFIWIDNKGQKHLIQVCLKFRDYKTKKREIRSLIEAMDENKINSATVITLEDEETMENKTNKIFIIPAWKYLLD